jgi:hypothetical protein
VGTEDEIEPGLPGIAAIERGCGGFADAAFDGLPNATDFTFFAGGSDIGTGKYHFAGLEFAFDFEQFAAIGDPGLVPKFARGVIDREALAFVAVRALVVFAQDTAFENLTYVDVRVFGGAADFEGVPIAEPEIELMKLGGGAGSEF